MPSNLMFADTMFPRLQEGEDPGSAIKRTNNYLFMLVEQLRYSFHNLELANFNNAALDSLKEIITDPIYASIQDTNGNLAELALTAEGLSSRIKDTEGNISTLTQTANSLQSQIKDANGSISAVSQTANKINWLVASGTSASDFTMTDRAASLVADKIDLTGFVTFFSLSTAGKTTIHGGNITTGKISTDHLHLGGEMLLYSGAEPTVTSYHGSFGAYQGLTYDANGNPQYTNGVGIRYSSSRGQVNCTSGGVWCGCGSTSGISAYPNGVTIKGKTINVTSNNDDVVLSSSDGTIALRLDWSADCIVFWVDNTRWLLDADGLHK